MTNCWVYCEGCQVSYQGYCVSTKITNLAYKNRCMTNDNNTDNKIIIRGGSIFEAFVGTLSHIPLIQSLGELRTNYKRLRLLHSTESNSKLNNFVVF